MDAASDDLAQSDSMDLALHRGRSCRGVQRSGHNSDPDQHRETTAGHN